MIYQSGWKIKFQYFKLQGKRVININVNLLNTKQEVIKNQKITGIFISEVLY